MRGLARAIMAWRARRGPGLGAHALAENAVLPLPGGPGVLVRVEVGQVLVTRAGDPEDHVLEAGAALSLDGRGRALAWALEASRIQVCRERERAALPVGPAAGVARRLAG